MNDSLNAKKLFSGKYVLAVMASVCMLIITIAVSSILWNQRAATEINSGVMIVITLLSNLLTAIVTHYFTKKVDP